MNIEKESTCPGKAARRQGKARALTCQRHHRDQTEPSTGYVIVINLPSPGTETRNGRVGSSRDRPSLSLLLYRSQLRPRWALGISLPHPHDNHMRQSLQWPRAYQTPTRMRSKFDERERKRTAIFPTRTTMNKTFKCKLCFVV